MGVSDERRTGEMYSIDLFVLCNQVEGDPWFIGATTTRTKSSDPSETVLQGLPTAYQVSLPAGEWHHYVMVVDELATSLSLYLDGEIVSNVTLVEDSIPPPPSPIEESFGFGIGVQFEHPSDAEPALATSAGQIGDIDEWAFWNFALSPTDVSIVYGAAQDTLVSAAYPRGQKLAFGTCLPSPSSYFSFSWQSTSSVYAGAVVETEGGHGLPATFGDFTPTVSDVSIIRGRYLENGWIVVNRTVEGTDLQGLRFRDVLPDRGSDFTYAVWIRCDSDFYHSGFAFGSWDERESPESSYAMALEVSCAAGAQVSFVVLVYRSIDTPYIPVGISVSSLLLRSFLRIAEYYCCHDTCGRKWGAPPCGSDPN